MGVVETAARAGLGRKLRVARRSRQVLAVLVSHGLSDALGRLQLPSWLLPESLSHTSDREERSTSSTPQRVCEALEELGPTFVKLGQFLSTRRDLLPDEWTSALARFQDAVKPVPWDEIDQQLHQSLGERAEEVFEWVDTEPLAAGSVAQVHRARLSGGDAIVLKILRPGIREVIQADLDVLALIARVAERRGAKLGFRPTELVRDFAEDRFVELDLMHEGRANDRLRRLHGADDGIVFPRVYWQVSAPRVLALEELAGRPLSQVDRDSLTPESARIVVSRGCRAIVRQCLEFGFFHADPHPGNLFLLEGDRLGFIDCGITGYLDSQQRHLLADLVKSILANDARACQRFVVDLTEADPGLVDDRGLRRSIQDFLVDFDDATLEELDITGLLTRLFDVLRKHDMSIQGDLVKLLKALTAVEAVAEQLDPEFDLATEVALHVGHLARRQTPEALARRAMDALTSYTSLFEELPGELSVLLDQLRRKELGVSLSHRGLGRLTAAIVFASRLVAVAMLVAALLVSGAIILLASEHLGSTGRVLGIAALSIAALLGLFTAVKHFRYRDEQ